ncbi:transposase [Methylotuvimicrobium alcaliphilum]|uniref:transposase n=1 Tax=Methylotuvimicrobium alcaliphilum TaxID=271065 RepID=UPI0013922108
MRHYGARWKIESGFKELKQDIGSQKCQCRNAQAVINHLHFCMMATTITWIYSDRIKADPQRRHQAKGRTSFAFSDVRRLIAEASLSENFDRVCQHGAYMDVFTQHLNSIAHWPWLIVLDNSSST